jgi:HlyD family secretion protein
MDIPRKSAARNRRIRQIVYRACGLLLVGAISLGLSRLKPAAPGVERATVWIDTVKRGPMVRKVRGLGRLAPEDIRWIPAASEGRVERRLVMPGTAVHADTVLLELSNPELEVAALDALSQLKSAEAELENLHVKLQTELLDKQAVAAGVQSEYNQAKAESETNQALAKDGLIPDLTLRLSRAKAEGLSARQEIEGKRLAIQPEAARAQLAMQQTKVEQLRALYNLKRSQVEALKVRAGAAGVLQELPIEVGQRVVPGTNLARVANPLRLKAELKIPETQAKDVMIGQKASIDTHNGEIAGKVIRVDPAVQQGNVTVDVALIGALPKGCRPDLSVDGTIELENLADVVYVGRPALGQEKSTIQLFKLEPDGKHAGKVLVKLGRVSVSTVEIVEGLKPGDEVILSDMNRWDNVDRIRLE